MTSDGALTLGQTGVESAAAGFPRAPSAFALVAAVVAHGAECSPCRSNNQTCVRGVSHLDVVRISPPGLVGGLPYPLATVRSHVL
jgi:hypothetical protein